MGSIDALILGGGFAGLSAACALAGAGLRARVLEKRQHLGGRARSYRDAAAQESVDNGQHLLLGCYRETRSFLSRIGSLDLLPLSPGPRVAYAMPGGERFTLSCPPLLPAPAHMLAGVLALRGVPWSEKRAIFRLGTWFRDIQGELPGDLDRLSVEQWLAQLGQGPVLRERFYFPLALGALNEDPRRASALGFAQVLRRIFFGGREASRLALPTVGLSELYVEQARAYLERRGGEVRFGAKAVALDREEDGLRVTCESGEALSAPFVIGALPPWDLARLRLPSGFSREWEALRPSPILSVHLWLDRPLFSEPLVGLLRTRAQWAFNRSALLGLASGALTLVLSGAHEQLPLAPKALLEQVLEDLRACFPGAEKATIRRWTVIKEPRATLSPVPGAEALRPGARTPVPGFFLAGDWVRTGLPATIESAVQSGHAAAELVRGEAGA